MRNNPFGPLTKSQRDALLAAAKVIEIKAGELSWAFRCGNSLKWDDPRTGKQHAENMKIANRLRGMASSKTSRL